MIVLVGDLKSQILALPSELPDTNKLALRIFCGNVLKHKTSPECSTKSRDLVPFVKSHKAHVISPLAVTMELLPINSHSEMYAV